MNPTARKNGLPLSFSPAICFTAASATIPSLYALSGTSTHSVAGFPADRTCTGAEGIMYGRVHDSGSLLYSLSARGWKIFPMPIVSYPLSLKYSGRVTASGLFFLKIPSRV